MIKVLFFGIALSCMVKSIAQNSGHEIAVNVNSAEKQPVYKATVSLLKKDSSIVGMEFTDASGNASFKSQPGGEYILKITSIGYVTLFRNLVVSGNALFNETVILQTDVSLLKNVSVTTKKPAIQFLPDKTVINVESSITSAGATVMDVLEKSPGITINRDGSIIMKGKPQVMVLIDGKQTQLSGADLQSYLSGLPASQIATIELIDNPGAKYDAAGNAGIINIRTKTNKQFGFNGSLALSIGQGFFSKTNNSLNVNFRKGKFNLFLNYGNRLGRERMKIYTLRKYHDVNGRDSVFLQQPNVDRSKISSHNVKAGVDFLAGQHTTLGLVFTANLTRRENTSFSSIDWMSPSYVIDSSIVTSGTRNIQFERAGLNFNARHSFSATDEISLDIDFIRFDITGDQYYQTQLISPGSPVEATKGNIPSSLEIFTGKADYSKRFNGFTWETGIKTAGTGTDNLAEYYILNGSAWQLNLSRSNHFLYDEKIHSAYTSLDREKGKWHWQAGLRYELTSYKANQLGNTVVKDSAFKKNYASLFPSGFISFNIDSNNTISFRLGRRIDRPPFQSLNPFLVTLNKYTFEAGNPFIRPQYTWNFELTHNYKQLLSTGISYSYLKDYFSQIFIIDSNASNINKNTIIYTRGNVGSFQNAGVTVTLQLPVTKWWNVSSTLLYNHKIIKGVVWKPIKAVVDQLNVSLNNQFQFKKGWSAELGGYYQTKSQIDLQEWLTPQGQLDAGISKQILKNKGTLRLTVRDIFHTQNYSGYSTFENSDEPFRIKWDTRVVRLAFSWRFGKAMKAIKRSAGGATEETDRVGTGN
jgi:hypothetical protein